MRRGLPRLGLLGTFSLMTLACLAVLGFALSRELRAQTRARALASAVRSAETIAELGVRPQLTAEDLNGALGPARLAALDRTLAGGQLGPQVARVLLYDGDGRIVFSDDRAAIGRSSRSAEIPAAMRGDILADLTDAAEVDPQRTRGSLLEVYVPLRLGARSAPAGVVELYVPYGPYEAGIARDLRRIDRLLIGGLALLFAALFPIMATASRRLRRNADARQHDAFHDALTGLPNRMLFRDRVEQATLRATREADSAAVLIIDLNRFKDVNDSLGHAAGDALLQQVGQRLRESLRASDTVARLGGDEFAVLLPNAGDKKNASDVAVQIRDALATSITVDGVVIDVEPSIGIALFPYHGADADTLVRCADVAMYVAKRSHRLFALYESANDENTPERLALTTELRQAIERRELQLHYQPQLDLKTRQVVAVEALARWTHPTRGPIPPDQFVSLAEHTGLIKPLTLLVLEQALAQNAAWRDEGLDLEMAVNVSARNLVDRRFPDDVARLLQTWRIAPNRLELEITERTILDDAAELHDALGRLRGLGVRIAIDDFGTGFSSLASLRQVPMDRLKIDRSFVMTMATIEHDAAIVRSIVGLASNLGLSVVAEGVETEEILAQLTELGCDVAQGYHVCRPIPASDLTGWLAARAATPADSATPSPERAT